PLLPLTITITSSGTVSPSPDGARPDPGTPLDLAFRGFVDFQAATSADNLATLATNATVTYTFNGLNPLGVYSFKASAVAGGTNATSALQWSLFQIDGAVSFNNVHTIGCFTNGLAPNQVAINTGINLIGDMADWENIVPSTNGSFSITCSQYTGPIPTGGTASGPYAYALGGFRLEEINTYAPTIFSATSTRNQVQVLFSLPVDPVSASMPVNYTVTNEYETIAVLAAATGASNETVELTTARQLPFMRHWLTVNRVA